MRFTSLNEWLQWQERLHPAAIELTLERPAAVLARLGCGRPAPRVITVAGTNGKGSSVALAETILRAAGYRVGSYTSPHIQRYNERIRIDGAPAPDAAICAAFEAVDQARGDVSLTYFEFGTLAALHLFAAAGLDVALLEVGMGGRLDAVNLVDPDVALITAIDLDHAAWLGPDREAIGAEKAGILRPGGLGVVSDPSPPASVQARADAIGARLCRLGRDFRVREGSDAWSLVFADGRDWADLPPPALAGRFQLDNAAGVLAALDGLSPSLPVPPEALRRGLREVVLAGRFQRLPGAVEQVLDVAHNPQAARELAANLAARPVAGRTLAVFGALADKDLGGLTAPLAALVDRWFVGPVRGPRAADGEALERALEAAGAGVFHRAADVAAAYRAARADARPGDRIVLYGSFLALAEAGVAPV